MNRLKVMTIVGTRPEVIRLSRVLGAGSSDRPRARPYRPELTIASSMRSSSRSSSFEPPIMTSAPPSDTPAETIGRVIIGVDRLLGSERPEAVLVLGDTDSCLAAISAKRRRIPVFHMEAGNRCFDDRGARRNQSPHRRPHRRRKPALLIDRARISARRRLPADRIIKTGSPLFEVLKYYRGKIDRSDILKRLGLKADEYFLVSAHRAENVDSDERIGLLVRTLQDRLRKSLASRSW